MTIMPCPLLLKKHLRLCSKALGARTSVYKSLLPFKYTVEYIVQFKRLHSLLYIFVPCYRTISIVCSRIQTNNLLNTEYMLVPEKCKDPSISLTSQYDPV